MKKQAIIEIIEDNGAGTYIVGTAVNVTVTGGQRATAFNPPGAASDGDVFITVGGRRRALGDVKVYRTYSTTGGLDAPAAASVTAVPNSQNATMTVTAAPAVGAAPTGYILGLTGTLAPQPVFVEGGRTHVFSVNLGRAYTPFARAVYGGALSVKTFGAVATATQVGGAAPVFASGPTIIGSAQAYEILTVDAEVQNGALAPELTVWSRDGEEIVGRVGAAIRLSPSDVNHRIGARVTAVGDNGFTTVATAPETGQVTGREVAVLTNPTITGGGRVGDTQTLVDGTANYWSELYRVFKIGGQQVINGRRGYNENTLTWVPEAADIGLDATLENTLVGTESKTIVSAPVTVLAASAPAPGPAPAPAPGTSYLKLNLSLATNPTFDATTAVGVTSRAWDPVTETFTYTTSAGTVPLQFLELGSFPANTFKPNTTYSFSVTTSAGGQATMHLYNPERSSGALISGRNGTFTTGSTVWPTYAQIRFEPPAGVTDGKFRVAFYEGTYTGASPTLAGAPAPAPAPTPSPSPAPSPSATAINLALATPAPGASRGITSATWDETTQTLTYTATEADAEYWLALDQFPAGTFKADTTYSVTQASSLSTATIRVFLYTGAWADRASGVCGNGAIVTWSTAATVIPTYGQIKFSIPTAGTGTIRVAVYEGTYGGAAPAPAPTPTPAPAPAPSPTPAPAPTPATGLPTRANIPMQPAMTTGAIPYQDVLSGPFGVLNDTWGVKNAQGAFSQQVGISPVQADGSCSARFIWNFTTCVANYNDVLSYPAIRWGTMVNKAQTAGSTLPKQISQINTLVNRATWDVAGAQGLAHVSADFWLASAGGYGTPANRRCEIMMTMWSGSGYCLPYVGSAAAAGRTAGNYSTAKYGARNPNIWVERVTLGGVAYDVYHGIPNQVVNGAYTRPSWYVGGPNPDKNWTLPWHFIAFVPVTLPPMGSVVTIDWVPVLAYIVSKGWATNAHYLWGVQWGIEPVCINKNGDVWASKGDAILNLKVTQT